MSIITLLTDFGIADEYVGLMKGVILSINPSAKIVDITHQIDPQDIRQAAYTIKASYRYFPPPCVHLVIVDPEVGTGRNILVLDKAGHVFVAPDNGVLSLVLREETKPTLLKVNNTNYFLESISRTFHGRDIIAPIGARIAGGLALSELGPRIHTDDAVCLTELTPKLSDQGDLLGRVVSIDRFGNLVTNVDSDALNAYCKNKDVKAARIRFGDQVIAGLSETYANVQANAPVALIGSRGYLEIAVNKGSAKEQFQVAKGSVVRVSL